MTEVETQLQAIVAQALEQTVNGLVIADMRAGGQPIVHVNPGFERITGYRADEVIGRNCRFLQGFDTEQPGVARLREAVARGEACTAVVRNYRKDGSLFWNRVEIGPVRDAATGELTHYFALQTDVTAEQEALSVCDPGIGMTADEQTRLFTRFFRARTDIPGTGLGLVIVRELIERMGGRITVRSQPGAGTTFTLHLRTVSPWTF